MCLVGQVLLTFRTPESYGPKNCARSDDILCGEGSLLLLLSRQMRANLYFVIGRLVWDRFQSHPAILERHQRSSAREQTCQ
jgi:hypothetical protein